MRFRNVILIGFILLLIFIYTFRGILTPFILAALLAYILNPFVTLLQRKLHFHKVVAIISIYLLLLSVLIAAGVWIGGGLLQEVQQIKEESSETSLFDIQTLNQLPSLKIGDQEFGLKPVVEAFPNTLVDGATHLQNNLWPFVTNAFGRAVATLVFLVSTFYLLKDGNKFIRFLRSIFPDHHHEKLNKLETEVNQVLGNYLRAEVLLILIMGASSWLALTILGVKFAITLAVLTGFLELIPFFGPIAAGAIAGLTAYSTGNNYFGLDPLSLALVVAVIYTTLRLLEDYFVIPQLLGHVTKLHPLVVLFSVLAGGHLAGALGFILAVPVVATLRIVVIFLSKEVRWKEA